MDNIILWSLISLVIIWGVLIAFYATRVKRVGPNEAIVVSGRAGQAARITEEGVTFRVVIGGRTFIWPIVETYAILSLEAVRADFKLDGLVSSDGKRVSVAGKVQYKVPAEKAAVIKAAEHFLTKSEEAKKALIMDLLESNLRRVAGEVTKEEIEQLPVEFADRVMEVGQPKLAEMGVEVTTLIIEGVS